MGNLGTAQTLSQGGEDLIARTLIRKLNSWTLGTLSISKSLVLEGIARGNGRGRPETVTERPVQHNLRESGKFPSRPPWKVNLGLWEEKGYVLNVLLGDAWPGCQSRLEGWERGRKKAKAKKLKGAL